MPVEAPGRVATISSAFDGSDSVSSLATLRRPDWEPREYGAKSHGAMEIAQHAGMAIIGTPLASNNRPWPLREECLELDHY
jgi:hypothetical protein